MKFGVKAGYEKDVPRVVRIPDGRKGEEGRRGAEEGRFINTQNVRS
jgi:hypothetical protein